MSSYELSVAGSPVVVNKPFAWLQEYLEENCAGGSVHVLCDTNTAIHCLPLLSLRGDHVKAPIVIPAGEENKTIASCEMIWTLLSEQGADRHSTLISLGGGMITDIGGFCASTYMRGIRFIHIPTSLLAMCDAALGGKHGIDFNGLKNYIGVFSQPQLIFINTDFLKTLPSRQFHNGMAEIVKAAIIGDREMFTTLSELQSIDSLDDDLLYRAILVKRKFVDEDYRDTGIRAALNFGHTIGHAIESFSLEVGATLLHGECVAIGMMIETMLSYKVLGSPDQNTCRRITDLIHKTTPVTVPWEISIRELREYLLKDKKQKDGAVHYTLIKEIGQPVIAHQVPFIVLEKLLRDEEVAALVPWLRHS